MVIKFFDFFNSFKSLNSKLNNSPESKVNPFINGDSCRYLDDLVSGLGAMEDFDHFLLLRKV